MGANFSFYNHVLCKLVKQPRSESGASPRQSRNMGAGSNGLEPESSPRVLDRYAGLLRRTMEIPGADAISEDCLKTAPGERSMWERLQDFRMEVRIGTVTQGIQPK